MSRARDWQTAELRDRGKQASIEWRAQKQRPVSDSEKYARRSAAKQRAMKSAAMKRLSP